MSVNVKNMILGLSGLLLSALPLAAQAQDNHPSAGVMSPRYGDVKIERKGQEVLMSVTVYPTSEKLGAQEILYIQPYLVSADGSKQVEMEPISIAGPTRYKVIRRQELYNNSSKLPATSRLFSYRDFPREGYRIEQSVPYERWMLHATMEVREFLYGCAECGISEVRLPLSHKLLRRFGRDQYDYNFYEPQSVAVKRFADRYESKVRFHVDRDKIVPSFEDNTEELEGLDRFIHRILSVRQEGVGEIHILGYASPEAPMEHNIPLSERRARAFHDFLLSKYPALKSMGAITVRGEGEDWDGLRKSIELSSLPNKAQLLDIIDRYSTDTEREEAIYALDGKQTYYYLLKELYPPLRRSTIEIRYEVRPYTVQELPEIFGKSPESMSHQELYLLAQKRASEGQDALEVYKYAYERYKSDPLAALNYANALLKYKQDAREALRVLVPYADDARSILPRAIAYDLLGEYEKADDEAMHLK